MFHNPQLHKLRVCVFSTICFFQKWMSYNNFFVDVLILGFYNISKYFVFKASSTLFDRRLTNQKWLGTIFYYSKKCLQIERNMQIKRHNTYAQFNKYFQFNRFWPYQFHYVESSDLLVILNHSKDASSFLDKTYQIICIIKYF